MPIAWTESETLKLLNLYGRYKCLRNPFHCDFKDKLCRYKAYKELVDRMNINGLTICDCIKRITYMKTQYCYELSKISAAIACDKFYKPRTNWFPIMHELLFPFIQACSYTDDPWKIRNEREKFPHLYSTEKNDNFKYSDSAELGQTLCNDCSCSYSTCQCIKLHKTRSPMHLKKFRIQADSGKKIVRTNTSITADYSRLSSTMPNKVDAGNNTNNKAIVQHETQTDVSYFKNDYECLKMYKGNEISISNKDCDQNCTGASDTPTNSKELECVDNFQIEDSNKGRKKPRDEFDMFGKSIAFQLRNINFETALKLEKHIQDLITQERLENIKSKCTLQSIDSDCSCTCNDCKIIHKEMICHCGLPIISIKTDALNQFSCK